MTKELSASVVVAVSGDQRIYRLVHSLLLQTVQPESFEVIIVENGTYQFSDLQGVGNGLVKYIHLAQANMAAARNAGLAIARGRYLMTTDADVVASPSWLEGMICALDGGKYGGVGGGILKFEPRTWIQKYAITIVDGQQKLSFIPALHLPFIAGANSGFVTQLLRQVGGFDQRFISGSDVEICYRLGLQGHNIGLACDAVVFHEDRQSIAQHFQRFKRYAEYQVLLFATYKHVTGRRFVLNLYPFQRTISAIKLLPKGLVAFFIKRDIGPLACAFLQIVEAVGVWCGDIQGAIRFRQIYL